MDHTALVMEKLKFDLTECYWLSQGRIQDLARGGAQTGQVVGGWGDLDSLVSSCIFEAGNNTPLSSLSLLIFTILAFADGCEVLKAV